MWKEINELEEKYDIFVSEQYADKLEDIKMQMNYVGEHDRAIKKNEKT